MIKEITSIAKGLIQGVDPPRRRHRIKLHWIAAHKDVKGNEKADEEAKKAASGNVTPAEHLRVSIFGIYTLPIQHF